MKVQLRDYFFDSSGMERNQAYFTLNGIPSGIENGMFQFGKLAIQSTRDPLPDHSHTTTHNINMQRR